MIDSRFATRTACCALFVFGVLALASCSEESTDSTPPADDSDATVQTDTGPPLTGAGLVVESATARSCEVLLEGPDRALQHVDFDDTVEGRFLSRGAKTAVAFFRKGDEAFVPGSITLQLVGGADAVSSLSVVSAKCFGADGAEVTDANIVINK